MRRHRFDPVSLLFGGLFVLVALVFLLGDPDLTSVRLQWVWPMGVIVLGGLIILLALARGRGGEEIPAESAPIPPASAAPGAIEPSPVEPERSSSAEPFEPSDVAPRDAADGLEPRDPSDVFDDDASFSEESSLS